MSFLAAYSQDEGTPLMKSRVHQVHGDLTLVIPPAIASSANVADGSEVDLTVENGCIVVAAPSSSKYSLPELLAKVTDENLHGEIDWGSPLGNEAW
jgi:antitoxin MazE